MNSCWGCGLTCKPIHPIHTHRRGMHIFRVGHGPFCSSDGSRHNVTHRCLVPPCTRQICKPVKPTTQSPPGHKLLNHLKSHCLKALTALIPQRQLPGGGVKMLYTAEKQHCSYCNCNKYYPVLTDSYCGQLYSSPFSPKIHLWVSLCSGITVFYTRFLIMCTYLVMEVRSRVYEIILATKLFDLLLFFSYLSIY